MHLIGRSVSGTIKQNRKSPAGNVRKHIDNIETKMVSRDKFKTLTLLSISRIWLISLISVVCSDRPYKTFSM